MSGTLEEARRDADRYPARAPAGSCPRSGELYGYEVGAQGMRFTLTCHSHPEFIPALFCAGLSPSKDGVLWEHHTDYVYKPGILRL